jgi:hypothetical protein
MPPAFCLYFALISRQYTEVKGAHDRVRDLRDAKS